MVRNKTNRQCGDNLPPKFTAEERKAYDWLYACNIRPWLVDFLTKKVTDLKTEFKSLIEFARYHGWHN